MGSELISGYNVDFQLISKELQEMKFTTITESNVMVTKGI
jgi:hypothetical protein